MIALAILIYILIGIIFTRSLGYEMSIKRNITYCVLWFPILIAVIYDILNFEDNEH